MGELWIVELSMLVAAESGEEAKEVGEEAVELLRFLCELLGDSGVGSKLAKVENIELADVVPSL